MPESALPLQEHRPVLGVTRSALGRAWLDRCDPMAATIATAIAQGHGVADVLARVLAGRGVAVSLTGLHRATLGSASADEDGVLRVDYEARPDQVPPGNLTRELEREYRAVVDEILELRGDDGRIRAFVRSITDTGALADTAGYSPDFNFSQKLQIGRASCRERV